MIRQISILGPSCLAKIVYSKTERTLGLGVKHRTKTEQETQSHKNASGSFETGWSVFRTDREQVRVSTLTLPRERPSKETTTTRLSDAPRNPSRTHGGGGPRDETGGKRVVYDGL